MPRVRRCPHCGDPLLQPDGSPGTVRRKTCGKSKCRSKRSRELAKAKMRARQPRYDDAVRAIAPSSTIKDVGKEVIREEIRPVIQEAVMTEEVTAALARMVALTPLAIECIEEDLHSRDDNVRQKAYTLVMRYTAGNEAIAPRREEDKPQPMQVVFNVPGAPSEAPALEAPAEELKACTECGQEHPESAFVAGSDRCQPCHDEFMTKLSERFPDR